jgi:hypothetical protein
MGLELDALATSIGNIVNHLDGPSDITTVIDTNFRDHEWSECITNLAGCDCEFADVHGHDLILI